MTVLSSRSGFVLTDGDGQEVVEVLQCRLWFPGGSYGGQERLFRSIAIDQQTVHVERFTGGAQEVQGLIRFHGDPDGLRALLREGARGRTLNYVPDLAIPSWSYPLVLMNYGEPVRIEPDPARFAYGEWQAPVTLRRVDGGELYSLVSGLLFRYSGGGPAPAGWTFSRSSVANRINRSRELEEVAANLRRVTWIPDGAGIYRPHTLLEAARTQLVTNPEDFSAWGTSGTIVTGGKADPFGGTDAYELDSNTPNASDLIYQAVGFTGDGEKCAALYFRKGTSTVFGVSLYDATTPAHLHFVHVTWTAGVPTATTLIGAGTIFKLEALGGGNYRLRFSAEGVVAADTNQMYVYPDREGGGGSVFVFGANAWNAVFPASYQGPSLSSRVADTLAAPFTAPLQGSQVFLRFARPAWADHSGDLGLYQTLYAIGAATAGNAGNFEIYAHQTLRKLVAEVRGAGNAGVTAAIPAGDPIDVLCEFVEDEPGYWKARLDMGAGFSAYSGTVAIDVFSGQLVNIGDGANQCTTFALRDLIVAPIRRGLSYAAFQQMAR